MNEYQQKVDELQKHFDKLSSVEISIRKMRIIKCALGMNEEAGELAHVVLKSLTGHYGFGNKEKEKEKVVDAVVDTFVFGIQILTEYGIKFEDAFPQILNDVLERNYNNLPHTPIQK